MSVKHMYSLTASGAGGFSITHQGFEIGHAEDVPEAVSICTDDMIDGFPQNSFDFMQSIAEKMQFRLKSVVYTPEFRENLMRCLEAEFAATAPASRLRM